MLLPHYQTSICISILKYIEFYRLETTNEGKWSNSVLVVPGVLHEPKMEVKPHHPYHQFFLVPVPPMSCWSVVLKEFISILPWGSSWSNSNVWAEIFWEPTFVPEATLCTKRPLRKNDLIIVPVAIWLKIFGINRAVCHAPSFNFGGTPAAAKCWRFALPAFLVPLRWACQNLAFVVDILRMHARYVKRSLAQRVICSILLANYGPVFN